MKEKTPREAPCHSKGWKVDSFAIPCFPDLSCSPTSALAPSSKTSVLPNLAHHHVHHLPFSSSQWALGKGPSLRGAPKGDSSTLKSLLRNHKSLGTFVLKQAEIPLESPRIAAPTRAGAGQRMWGAVRRTKCPQRTMGLPGTTQELLLPGNTTRERGAQAAVPAGQDPGPCRDACRCNNSIFIPGVTPPISYSNYHSTLTADSTPQLVPGQRHTAGNKLDFLPMETITSFNFECEPWCGILLLPWH